MHKKIATLSVSAILATAGLFAQGRSHGSDTSSGLTAQWQIMELAIDKRETF